MLQKELTHKSDGVAAGVDPVVLIANELRVGKPVRVHQRAQCRADLRLLLRVDETGGVRRVTVLRLILDANGPDGEALALVSLQCLEQIVRIWLIRREQSRSYFE